MNLQKLKRYFLYKDRTIPVPNGYVPVQARVKTEAEAVMVMLYQKRPITLPLRDETPLYYAGYYSPSEWKQVRDLTALHKMAKRFFPGIKLASQKTGHLRECNSPFICRIRSLSSPRFVVAWKDTSCTGWWVVVDPKTGTRLQTTEQLTSELAEPYILKTAGYTQ